MRGRTPRGRAPRPRPPQPGPDHPSGQPGPTPRPASVCTPPAPSPAAGSRYELCHLHHVIWWRHGGTTDLANLAPLCNRHHHAVHDDGWHLTLTTNRTLTITYPDGTPQLTGPPRRGPRPRPPGPNGTRPDRQPTNRGAHADVNHPAARTAAAARRPGAAESPTGSPAGQRPAVGAAGAGRPESPARCAAESSRSAATQIQNSVGWPGR